MQGYIGLAERVAMVDQGSVVKTNWDKFLDEAADMVSLPSKVVRTDDEVGAIRNQLAKQAQEQQAQMAMAQGVDNVQKLGNTPAGEETALGKLSAETEAGNA
jgi:hypothetical protein